MQGNRLEGFFSSVYSRFLFSLTKNFTLVEGKKPGAKKYNLAKD